MSEAAPYHLVIAKYNENMDWLNYIDTKNCIIYDKGANPIPNSMVIPNVGMNQETCFRYIVDFYNNLPEYVIFLQGNPFDHMPDTGITAQNLQKYIDIAVSAKPREIMGFFVNYHIHGYNELQPGLRVPQYYELFFRGRFPGKIAFTSGSQYIIPREAILARPLWFYQKIQGMAFNMGPNELLGFDPHFNNRPFDPTTITAASLERFFMPIFTPTIELNPDF